MELFGTPKNLLRIYIFEKFYYLYAKLSLKKLYLHKSMKTQAINPQSYALTNVSIIQWLGYPEVLF